MHRITRCRSSLLVPSSSRRLLLLGNIRSLSSTSADAAATPHSNEISPPPSISSHRETILRSSLTHVHTYGWTEDAVSQGVLTSQLPPTFMGLVTPQDLVSFFMRDCNARLRTHLQERPKNNTNMTTCDKIQHAVRHRLEMVVPYLKSRTWHEGMAMGATRNTSSTAEELEELVSIVLLSCTGGTYNSSLHRMAVGAVYVSTELHMLSDTSPGYVDTWDFLSHRMDEYDRLAKGQMVLPNQNTVTGATAVATSIGTAVLSLGLTSMPGIKSVMDGVLSNATSASTTIMQTVLSKSTGGNYNGGNSFATSSSSNDDILKDLPPFQKK